MASAFSLENFEVSSSADPSFRREVSFLIPAGSAAERLCLLLDGEFYTEQLNAVEVVEGLLAAQEIPPTAFAFVSHLDNAHRHVDYICNDSFADYITCDLISELRRRCPSLAESGHAIGGLSLSGLAAAHALIRHPGTFSAALCQSGSFWWNEEWLTNQESNLSGKTWYLSVGDGETQSGLSHQPSGMRQEVAQRDACERFAGKMESAGNQVRFEVFEGNHEMTPWAEELPEALRWLIAENSGLS